MYPTPIGIKFLRCILPKFDPSTKLRRYKVFILLATFCAYLCFHMTRRPIAIVKPVLNHNGNCTGQEPLINRTVTSADNSTWCDWDPFTGNNNYYGLLDSTYLFSYAVCMFASGFVAERMHLRYFLSLGMILSGLTTYAFGLGYFFNIHVLWFYFIVQGLGGAVQSSGWPAVVALMNKWYGKKKRGLIFGVWNAHTSVGNILGAIIASSFVDIEWGLSFVVPGVICSCVGLFVFLFVPANPQEIGVEGEESGTESSIEGSLNTVPGTRTVPQQLSETENTDESTSLLNSGGKKKAISFFKAFMIPGVIEFSLALFFAKLVSYTFLFWLPLYLETTTGYTAEKSAKLSTSFDYGGILGGIFAGWLCDRYGASALTSVAFLSSAIPMLIVYKFYGTTTKIINIALLFSTGFLVNGPYALITTAVSADLGNHPSISKSSNAMATVTAIIDGTGSIGAALGPLLADLLKNVGENWMGVFLMVMAADFFAVLCLSRITFKEVKRLWNGSNGDDS